MPVITDNIAISAGELPFRQITRCVVRDASHYAGKGSRLYRQPDGKRLMSGISLLPRGLRLFSFALSMAARISQLVCGRRMAIH